MKKLLTILLILTLIPCFSSCESDKEPVSLAVEMDAVPMNLDPVLAQSLSERQIIDGIFEYLMRIDENGETTTGAVESYTVSKKDLVYVFTLRDGLKWSDGIPLTASDFRYGMIRCLTKKTASRWASSLFNIKNAKNFYNGKVNSSKVGINAKDDKTLVITLSAANSGFLTTLALPCCAPCREDFFISTGGRYGLGRDYVIGNGPFALKSWYDEEGEDEYVRLFKNEYYNGAVQTAVDIIIINFKTKKDRKQRLENEIIQIATADNELIDSASEANDKVLLYQRSCLSLCLNPQNETLKNANLRKALMLSMPRSSYENRLSPHLVCAFDFVPTTAITGETIYRNEDESFVPAVDEKKAKKYFDKFMKETDEDADLRLEILYDGDEDTKMMLSYIVQQWQKLFGIYIDLSVTDPDDLPAYIANGDYEMTVTSFESVDFSAETMLSDFLSAGSPFKNLVDKKFKAYISSAKKSANDATAIKYFKKAEKNLLSNGFLLPLAHEMSGYIYTELAGNISLCPRGGIIELSTVGKK